MAISIRQRANRRLQLSLNNLKEDNLILCLIRAKSDNAGDCPGIWEHWWSNRTTRAGGGVGSKTTEIKSKSS